MSEWAAKRFWKAVDVKQDDAGYSVALDGRLVRTPAKSPLLLPTAQMAQAVAAEWEAQTDKIDPLSMPYTRAANAATDKVTHQFDEVADMLASYGDTDLICYRASDPKELVERQNKQWDPLVDWSATDLKAPLQVYVGVMHAPQPEASKIRLRALVDAFDPFQLTAFHDLVSLSGSLIIGFAVVHGYDTPQALWDVSRIDEDWQIQQWGEDEEAAAQISIKRDAFLHADQFFRVCA